MEKYAVLCACILDCNILIYIYALHQTGEFKGGTFNYCFSRPLSLNTTTSATIVRNCKVHPRAPPGNNTVIDPVIIRIRNGFFASVFTNKDCAFVKLVHHIAH